MLQWFFFFLCHADVTVSAESGLMKNKQVARSPTSHNRAQDCSGNRSHTLAPCEADDAQIEFVFQRCWTLILPHLLMKALTASHTGSSERSAETSSTHYRCTNPWASLNITVQVKLTKPVLKPSAALHFALSFDIAFILGAYFISHHYIYHTFFTALTVFILLPFNLY